TATGLIVGNVMSQQPEDAQQQRVRQLRENAFQNNFVACLNAWAQIKANIANAGPDVEPTDNERELLKGLDVCVAEGKLRQVERELTDLVKEHPETAYATKAKMALKALKFDNAK